MVSYIKKRVQNVARLKQGAPILFSKRDIELSKQESALVLLIPVLGS